MQIGKKNTYIFKDNAKVRKTSLPDTLRDAMGKYWVVGKSSLKYGNEQKANKFSNTYHLDLSYGQVITRLLKNPPFCSKEQEVYFYGHESFWHPQKKEEPLRDWKKLINTLVPQNLSMQTNLGTLTKTKRFKDYSFRIDTPLDQRERKKFGDVSNIGYANVDFNYNFYVSGFEKTIRSVREELLPNLYAFLSEDISRNMYYLRTMKGMIADQKASIRRTSASEAQRAVESASPTMALPVNYGELVYFNLVSAAYKKAKREFMNNFSVRYQNFIFPFENLSLLSDVTKKESFPMYVEVDFSTDSATEIAQILEDASLSTSFQRQVAAACGGTNLTLLKQIGGSMENLYAVKQNSSQSPGGVGRIIAGRGSYKTLDLLTWWKQYLKGLVPTVYKNQTFVGPDTYSAYISSGVQNNNLAQALNLLVFSGKLRDIVKDNLRSFEEVMEGVPCHTETVLYRIAKYSGSPENSEPIQNYWFPNSNNIEIINFVDTQVKYNKRYTYIVYAYQLVVGTEYHYGPVSFQPLQQRTRTVEVCPEITFPRLSGMKCNRRGDIDLTCVKADYLKVVPTFKLLGTDTANINALAQDIVTIYVFSGSLDALAWSEYVAALANEVSSDYGFESTNFLDALAVAIVNYGTGEIDSISVPPVEQQRSMPQGPTAKVNVMTYPLVNVVEVPFFSHSGFVVDSPPVPPNTVITPYRGDNGKILIWLNSSVGDYEAYPIPLSQSEKTEINKIRRTNYLSNSEPIRYRSDDIASAFEIFRLTEKPEIYQDFANSRRAFLSTLIKDDSLQRSSSASYVDTVTPNTKYYYMFRAVDIHNHKSNPTEVYEVELVDNDGAIFMVTNIIPLEEKPPPFDTTKVAKRYINIVPRITQGIFNKERSGLGAAPSALTKGTQYALGVEDESIWGKKYKIRFISKSTGRKIDLNVTYSKEHVVSPEEIELRKLGPTTVTTPVTIGAALSTGALATMTGGTVMGSASDGDPDDTTGATLIVTGVGTIPEGVDEPGVGRGSALRGII